MLIPGIFSDVAMVAHLLDLRDSQGKSEKEIDYI